MTLYSFCFVLFLAIVGFFLCGISTPLTNIVGGICAIVCAVLLLAGRN